MKQFLVLLLIICLFNFFSINNVDCYLGVNWGRQASQRIVPSMIIDLLLQNGIPDVKIFTASQNVLPSFIGTNLGLTVTIPNDDLKFIKSQEDAENWIDMKLDDVGKGINLRYISIGTQPFSKMSFNKTYDEAVEVLDYMQGAIDKIYPDKDIKVAIDHYTDVMTLVTKPSEAEFKPDVKDLVIRSTTSLSRSGAPIWLDMFPIYSAKLMFKDIEFAFFDNNSTSHFTDIGGYKYTNIFEVVYDKFVCALEKEGFRDIKVVVGQVGWPTDGLDGASEANAARYHKGLIKHILSGKGTPRRPGPIDVYLHNLLDENLLPIKRGGERGGFIRHWGIYKFDGKPKYNIDFSGKGRDMKPVSAKGVTRYPKRWCVFNNKTMDMGLIQPYIDKACKAADCTNLDEGGSCESLGYPSNISYAFNAYFQAKKQKIVDLGCDFGGLGLITADDPSINSCSFPVEIISAELAVTNQGNMLIFMRTDIVVGIIVSMFFMTLI